MIVVKQKSLIDAIGLITLVGIILAISITALSSRFLFALPPIVITTCQELIDTFPDDTTNVDATVELGNSIDCTGYTVKPFFDGNPDNGFTGIFDGKNYTVSNYTVDNTGTTNTGFFSQAITATIKDITFTNFNASYNPNAYYSGGLIGYADTMTINNVHIIGTVEGKSNVGGLIGEYESWWDVSLGDSSITNSSFSGIVRSQGIAPSAIGGLIGGTYIGYNNVDISHNNTEGADIQINDTTANYIGGLTGVAQVYRSDIAETHLTMSANSVTGVDTLGVISDPTTVSYNDVGGLIGYASIVADGMFETSGTTVSSAVTGTDYVAGLIGYQYSEAYSYHNTDIHNTRLDVATRGHHFVGGLIGMVDNSNDGNGPSSSMHIHDVSATGQATGRASVGGLIGFVYSNGATAPDQLLIERAYAKGDVYGRPYGGSEPKAIGGLVGESLGVGGTTIDQVYATGNVYIETIASPASTNTGGLIGDHDDLFLSNAFARGNVIDIGVNNLTQSGGAVGEFYNNSDPYLVENLYSTGSIDGSSGIGGLFGYTDPVTITSSYWDTDTSGLLVSAAGSGENTSAMKTQSTFSGWDFTSIWRIDPLMNDGYPCLSFSQECNNDVDGDGVSNAIENAGPNNGDGNSDGIADSDQSNVTTSVNPTTGKYVTVTTDNTATISSVALTGEVSNAVQDATYDYPAGFSQPTINTANTGDSTPVTVYYSGVNPSAPVAKTYDIISTIYTPVPLGDVTLSSQNINSVDTIVASYVATDGASYDLDGSSDGQILGINLGLGTLTNNEGVSVGAPNTGLAHTDTPLFIFAIFSGVVTILIMFTRTTTMKKLTHRR